MKLLFVYNANSGAINALLDSAHKLLSPATYNCKLCDLTYGLTSEDAEWKGFRASSEIDMTFLHKDEFLKTYKSKWLPKFDFPIVLVITPANLEVFITEKEMGQMEAEHDLINTIQSKKELF